MTFSRKSRSSRKRPLATSDSRSRLVAATTRTSALRVSVLADALERPLLQESQQLGLQARRHLADFVEEQRAALGHLDAPRLIADGAGEGALGVAEELAGQKLLGEGGAVDRYEGALAPRAFQVHRPREHALPGSVLAAEQQGDVRLRCAVNHLQDGVHRPRESVERSVSGASDCRRSCRSAMRTDSDRWTSAFSTRWRICAGVNGFCR